MKAEIDFTKSAQQNADHYYIMSKTAKKKTEGAIAAIAELEKRKEHAEKSVKKKELKEKREQKWYERFNWFFTSDGSLVIGGRSAKQNEEINSKHFENGDLFFHADVFGASVTILKKGESASADVRQEAASFAGAFSKAWESGASTVNVYALRREQVSKSKEKGSLGTGSFLLSGEREWHKNMALELAAFTNGEGENTVFMVAPVLTVINLNIRKRAIIKPGKEKKSDAAKKIAKMTGYADLDYIMQHLPPGTFSIS